MLLDFDVAIDTSRDIYQDGCHKLAGQWRNLPTRLPENSLQKNLLDDKNHFREEIGGII